MSDVAKSPVILGGDIGAYSIARSFHEAYGTRSTLVAQVAGGPVRHSKILDVAAVPNLNDDAALCAALVDIGARNSQRRLLLGSGDWLVRKIVANRDALQEHFIIPYVDLAVMEQVTVKRNFSQLCAQLGIPHPRTAVFAVGVDDPQAPVDLAFPVVAKPGDSSAYNDVRFSGKMKVFHVETAAELRDVLQKVTQSSYRGDFILQERIPGPDSNMRVLTCYSEADGEVSFASMGQVLLEEHTPGALGNPAVVMTGEVDDVSVDHARRLLQHVGWRGFSNFDLKVDPRTGEAVFFELNPRLGRSNFYLNVAGQNPARLYVSDYVQGKKTRAGVAEDEGIFSIVPQRTIKRFLSPGKARDGALAVLSKQKKRHPLWYWPVEKDPRRLFYITSALINQHRKFRRHFPKEQ